MTDMKEQMYAHDTNERGGHDHMRPMGRCHHPDCVAATSAITLDVPREALVRWRVMLADACVCMARKGSQCVLCFVAAEIAAMLEGTDHA